MRSYLLDRRPLAIPAFRRLWLASTVGAVGGSFGVVAVPTQLFTSTGSSAYVGAGAAVSFCGLAVGSLWIGNLADRVDRRRLLLLAHCGLALTYAALWAQAALGGRSIALLLALVACQGLTLGAIMVTMGTAVPRLVPVDLLPAANALTSLVRYAGAVLGPILAGALIPLVGLSTLYLLDAVALLAIVWAVARLPPILPSPQPVTSGPIAGFRYLLASRLLLALVAVDLAAMVFSLPTALLPELAERTYGGPSGGGMELGLLYAAYPIGVLAAGLMSGTFTRARRHGALMASAALAWGGAVVILGLAAQLWLAVAALVLGGAVNFVLSTFRNAISQAHTDDAMRGRIQGSLIVVLFGGPQLANVLHGTAAALYGPQVTICVGGLLTVVTVAVILRLAPEFWRYGTR